MRDFILSIDQGTTSSRAMLFDADGHSHFTAQQEFTQYFPDDGWVEHDPEEIWRTVLDVSRQAMSKANELDGQVRAIGITNQRETTLVWNRSSGEVIYNAIVWQDRRTAGFCTTTKQSGSEDTVSQKTGLLLDPYFSATKIRWILNHVDGARAAAERGELAFGTIDSFLIWRLTGGAVHATDTTNASRTLLFNIHDLQWDKELLALFEVPVKLLPEVKACTADFGTTQKDLFGTDIPICGVAGDQQAALVGQACFQPGMLKSTYGTGCFAILNTGKTPVASKNRLLTTIAYTINGTTHYAIEGSIFVAGAAVQWLRDKLKIIQSAEESEALAASLDSNNGVYLVPAFTGLGAPHWNPDARAAIFGMTRDTGTAELARAALESVCYQTADLLAAMEKDGANLNQLRVDGGMTHNVWLCGFLANILGLPVERPVEAETTALGAACLAGLQSGLIESTQRVESNWQTQLRCDPTMATEERTKLMSGWRSALQKVVSQ